MALTLVAFQNAASATGQIPATAAAGDLLVAFAERNNATNASLPAGWTSHLAATGSSNSVLVAWRIMQAGDSNPVFTNANEVDIWAFQGYDSTTPLGATKTLNASSTSINFGGVTLQITNGSSWVLTGAAATRPDITIPTPAGYTLRQATGNRPAYASFDTNGGVSSSADAAVTVTRADLWCTATVELRALQGTAFSRTASDLVSVSDAATRASQPQTRSASDSVSVSDAATRSIVRTRSTSDSVSVSDFAVSSASHPRTVSDSVSVSDSAVRAAVARTRSASDSVAVSDAATRAIDRVRSATDSVAVSDAAQGGAIKVRSASDSVTISDAATRIGGARPRSTADSVSISDAATRSTARARFASDSVTISDTASRAAGRTRSSSDSFSVSDIATRYRSGGRTASDTVIVSDVAVGALYIENANLLGVKVYVSARPYQVSIPYSRRNVSVGVPEYRVLVIQPPSESVVPIDVVSVVTSPYQVRVLTTPRLVRIVSATYQAKVKEN